MWVITSLIIMAVSGAALYWGAKNLIHHSRHLALQLGVSNVFVSLTVVALGTSLPELIVSMVALSNGDPGLATGNIIGSNVTNATLVFGIAIIIHTIIIDSYRLKHNSWQLLLVTFIYIIVNLTGLTNTTAGAMLIGAGLAITLLTYFRDTQGVTEPEPDIVEHYELLSDKARHNLFLLILHIGIAVVVILVAGQALVFATEKLSLALGIASTLIGLTLTALITSLPEIVTTFIAQRDGLSKMAVGNILGSNIYNLALIGGIIAFYHPQNGIDQHTFIYLVFSSIFLFFVVNFYHNRKIPYYIGIIGILAYCFYLLGLNLV